MSVNIVLSKSMDDAKKVGKTLTDVYTTTADLKKDTSIITPSIRLKIPKTILLTDFNMVKMFGYVYFVTDAIYVLGGMVELILELDELTTFPNEIKSLYCYVERAESKRNSDIYDPEVPTVSTKTIEATNIGSFGTATPHTYLVVSGGSSTTE